MLENFEDKGGLEIVWKSFLLSQFTLFFLETGLTAANLNAPGKTPVHKGSLIKLRTTGPREEKHDLNNRVGI